MAVRVGLGWGDRDGVGVGEGKGVEHRDIAKKCTSCLCLILHQTLYRMMQVQSSCLHTTCSQRVCVAAAAVLLSLGVCTMVSSW